MIGDIIVVTRKELVEALATPRLRRQNLVGIVVLSIVMDVPVLLGMPPEIAAGGLPFVGLFFMILGPMMTSADSFAGERERHTLETLLSTRLPDASIVLGKLASMIIVAFGSALVVVVQGLLLISLVTGDPLLFVGGLAVSLLVLVAGIFLGVFLGAIGILISMRAQTVQGAATALSFILMPIFILPAFIIALIGDRAVAFFEAAVAIGIGWVALGIVTAVLALDVGMVTIALAAFKRHRLMAK